LSQAHLITIAGSLLDLVVGVWLVSGRAQKKVCYLQIWTIGIYSVLLTAIAPEYWLDPFGAISKNIPVVVLIWLYFQQFTDRTR